MSKKRKTEEEFVDARTKRHYHDGVFHGESSKSDRKKRKTDKDILPDQQQRLKNLKCWNCKGQGHKASDRACPMFAAGKVGMERFRWDHEDPMKTYIENKKMREKEERLAHLKALVYLSSSSSSDSSSESLDSGDSKKEKKRKSKKHKDHKKKKKQKDESVIKRKKSHESKSMKDKYHKRSKHRHKHHHHKHKKK